ncbi:hypothetical protein WJX73_003693 [Symbiochloris irregularis]|uniref:Protein ENHANCED DISEASE RESISTANCE 2 C-terminal domain-containing protein n=1 Tax=Symbiochloris irregularis TaxID=706552 RepID=A0AAW1Q0U0_9CHLO
MGCCGTTSRKTRRRRRRASAAARPGEAGSSPADLAATSEQAEASSPEGAPNKAGALSPSMSVMSSRTVYYDAEEGDEEYYSDNDSHNSEPEKPSLWDVLTGTFMPKPKSTQAPKFNPQQAYREKQEQNTAVPGPGFAEPADTPSPSSPSPSFKPDFGASSRRRPPTDTGSTSGIECWEEADAASFMIRGQDYARTKKKELCAGSFYSLAGVDIYSFEQKINHIARHVRLPEAPQLGRGATELPENERIPPILVINVQLPIYSPAIFGGRTDGKGQSLVYYFTLPIGWQPEQVANQAALKLLQRFVHDGTEAGGEPTRDRLKLIARVANKEEWYKAAPLSSAEYRLLCNYNDKPLLTRPQQKFFKGSNYLEIDIDVHSYAYIARKAFSGFIPRLSTVVFENAFVVQGNQPDELPEMVLACARVSRVDFHKVRPFPGQMRRTISHRMTMVPQRTASGELDFEAARNVEPDS